MRMVELQIASPLPPGIPVVAILYRCWLGERRRPFRRSIKAGLQPHIKVTQGSEVSADPSLNIRTSEEWSR